MSSISRTIRRGMMFKDMNKQQKKLWHSTHKGVGAVKRKNRKRKKK